MIVVIYIRKRLQDLKKNTIQYGGPTIFPKMERLPDEYGHILQTFEG